jgi:hypothetical protein
MIHLASTLVSEYRLLMPGQGSPEDFIEKLKMGEEKENVPL